MRVRGDDLIRSSHASSPSPVPKPRHSRESRNVSRPDLLRIWLLDTLGKREVAMHPMVKTAHVDAVEKVKTGQGLTRFLIQNAKGDGPNIMIRYGGPETDVP